MKLYEEILTKVIADCIREKIVSENINADKIIQTESYKALCKIKSIIEDDKLEDEECFLKIEEIVRVFESIGSNGGNRHDFG